jgi:hypothetical protein
LHDAAKIGWHAANIQPITDKISFGFCMPAMKLKKAFNMEEKG